MKPEALRKQLKLLETEYKEKYENESNSNNKRFIAGQLDMLNKIYNLSKKP